jgi:excisionase family DNA binding protein
MVFKDKKFLSVNEFVEATSLSYPTVYRKTKTNEIPSVRVGQKILIPVSFLDELENKSRRVKK